MCLIVVCRWRLMLHLFAFPIILVFKRTILFTYAMLSNNSILTHVQELQKEYIQTMSMCIWRVLVENLMNFVYKIQVVSNTLSTTTANGTFYETIGALINIKTISNAELLPFFLSLSIVYAPLFSHISFSSI